MGGAGAGRVIPFFSGYKVDHEGPDAPRNLQAFQKSAGVFDMIWEKPPTGNIKYYSIYYTTISGGPYYMLYNYLKDTTYLFHAKFPETFYFVVTAVDSADNESALSDEIEVFVPDYGIPQPPAGLIAIPSGDNVELTWRASQEDFVSSYKIYRAMAPGVAFIPLASGITDTIYIDTTRVSTTRYHYVVAAVSIFNYISVYSNHAIVYPVSRKTFINQRDLVVKCYPNPVSNQLHVDVPCNNKFCTQIYSMDGKLIYSENFSTSHAVLNLETIQPGAYILHIVGNKNTIASELIIKME
jgi:hypothetical protein